MRDRDMKFFDVARSVAKLSTWSEIPREQTGAVVVFRNEVIGVGYNRRKTSPMQAYWAEKAGMPDSIYPHAEISALQKVNHGKKDLMGIAKIFVYRETQLGIAMARPCPICTLAIKAFGIKNIFYTSEDGYCEEEWI